MKSGENFPHLRRKSLLGDVLCAAAVLAVALCFWLPRNGRGDLLTAELTCNGQVLQQWHFSRLDPPETVVWEDKTIEFSAKGVRFSSSQCPDLSCVHTGWLSRNGDVSVCIPYGVVLTLHSAEESSTDATAR
ncbi:MAG: NusG domain II-containing protein [Clostridia bacterium]|nr:NusG domain II-containing protein [Clostridia bacterium]